MMKVIDVLGLILFVTASNNLHLQKIVQQLLVILQFGAAKKNDKILGNETLKELISLFNRLIKYVYEY